MKKIEKTRKATKTIVEALKSDNLDPAERSVMLIQLGRRGEDISEFVTSKRGSKSEMIRVLLAEGHSALSITHELKAGGIPIQPTEISRLEKERVKNSKRRRASRFREKATV